jgi:hypothetical protein
LSPPERPPLAPQAELAAYAGLVPFIGCLAAVALLPDAEGRDLAQRAAVAWGAVVLSFVGAVHWGLALAGRLAWSPARLIASIAPAVVGAAAVVLGGQRAFALLVAGFGLFWLYEHRRLAHALPADYLRLRRNLSLAVCALLALLMILSDTVGLR